VWLEQKKSQVDRWVPAADDYSGELLTDITPETPKKTRPDYKHRFWPSPRPRNFAKALGHHPRTHEQALDMLAKHANITVEELLETCPHVYGERYSTKYALRRVMPGERRPYY
jgi:hypothetical protein